MRCSHFHSIFFLLLSDCHLNYRKKKKQQNPKKPLEWYPLNSFYSKWGREISRESITGEWIAATFCLNCVHAKFLPRTGFDPFHGQLEYVFIESQINFIWKRPLRLSNPTVNPTVPSPALNHVPKGHIHVF